MCKVGKLTKSLHNITYYGFKIAGIMTSVHSERGSRDTRNYYLSCQLSPKFSDKHLPFSVKHLILLVRYIITSSRIYFLKSKPNKQGIKCQISEIFRQVCEKNSLLSSQDIRTSVSNLGGGGSTSDAIFNSFSCFYPEYIERLTAG